jgi:uncharacterized protein involved in oxidation of intracellular sulfur
MQIVASVDSVHTLLVINTAPYDGERAYNALRLATALSGAEAAVRVFLLGDGVLCGARRESPPDGATFNIEWMLQRLIAAGAEVVACRTCLESRALLDERLVEGVHNSTLDCLTRWTLGSERVLVF